MHEDALPEKGVFEYNFTECTSLKNAHSDFVNPMKKKLMKWWGVIYLHDKLWHASTKIAFLRSLLYHACLWICHRCFVPMFCGRYCLRFISDILSPRGGWLCLPIQSDQKWGMCEEYTLLSSRSYLKWPTFYQQIPFQRACLPIVGLWFFPNLILLSLWNTWPTTRLK